MFKCRGQPGKWYGYVEIDGVTYKIDAQHVGERVNKHFEGTVKRHLKADQGKLDLKQDLRAVAQAPMRKLLGQNPLLAKLIDEDKHSVDPDLDDSVEDIR